MKRVLFLIPLLASQVVSVERLGKLAIWRHLAGISERFVERAFGEDDHATLEGQVSFLLEAHTRLGVEYGQVADLATLKSMYLFWRDDPLMAVSRLGISQDGRLEGNLDRISFPHDELLGGKYESWLLSVANLTDKIIPPRGWEVKMHMLDGSVIIPASPDDPALVGTSAAVRPGRHLWRSELFPDTNTRIILLFPVVEHADIKALELSLDGTTVWIPWWENIL